MPHADIDLSLPWAIVSLLLAFTGFYGLWGSSKGSTWHKRQFVSASWGFLLMFLCWAVVYIAVEDHHAERVNGECVDRNKDNAWTLTECDDRRKKAVVVASVLVSIAMVIGIYFTLVLSKWVTSVEWEEHLERERRLDQWRSGHAEKETDVVA
ncbi:hypothetical protein BGW38_005578 [Lunasporangiospora selenospora]|uniref:Transmembrane protein n=1 Tax=Lunasporangiospora selenospora TaxID=979761 RepID=A0A9P6KAS2_9FUNG|nr:hypothetical protein BGW38_005578 [Lunasporangiospora selenospora]